MAKHSECKGKRRRVQKGEEKSVRVKVEESDDLSPRSEGRLLEICRKVYPYVKKDACANTSALVIDYFVHRRDLDHLPIDEIQSDGNVIDATTNMSGVTMEVGFLKLGQATLPALKRALISYIPDVETDDEAEIQVLCEGRMRAVRRACDASSLEKKLQALCGAYGIIYLPPANASGFDSSNNEGHMLAWVKLDNEELRFADATLEPGRSVFSSLGDRNHDYIECLGLQMQPVFYTIGSGAEASTVRPLLRVKLEPLLLCCRMGHALADVGIRNDEWTCDRVDEKMGCQSGCTQEGGIQSFKCFRCAICDFDLCPVCAGEGGIEDRLIVRDAKQPLVADFDVERRRIIAELGLKHMLKFLHPLCLGRAIGRVCKVWRTVADEYVTTIKPDPGATIKRSNRGAQRKAVASSVQFEPEASAAPETASIPNGAGEASTLVGRWVRKRFQGYGRGAAAFFEGRVISVSDGNCMIEWASDHSQTRMKEGASR